MTNVIVKMLDPDQYYLLETFCETHEISCPSPEWSKVVAAIDTEQGKIIGIVCAQMMIHTEPIIIDEKYQGKGIWEMLTESLEGYLEFLAFSSGFPIGVYNQPTNAAAERICRMRGYEKSDRPLYYKLYDGSSLVTNGVTKSNNE